MLTERSPVDGVVLGYEVGAGRQVVIPLNHLAVTGQTQMAGKTTTLEALIARSGLRAVTFLTKRGESAFRGARRVDPYFREQADWQFVASILEASRGERLKFERAWIIRASRGARTLADVQHNVRKAMEKAKGLSADVYLTLDAYLDVVVPEIARVRWAERLELAAGVNAVDVTALTVEMQHLVIRSTLEWVLTREQHTVVVVPEAWKFIPQGRGTPVKLAAESFIRQAAALSNFLWLDSQDIGGIEKTILRSVPVWVLGVQRETNEVKRTLDNIPAGTAKPNAADIATLELGQFYACWGKHVIKTYVQPQWLPAETAVAIAMGKRDVRHLSAHSLPVVEDVVTKEEADRLEGENRRLQTQVGELTRQVKVLETSLQRAQDRPAPIHAPALPALNPASGDGNDTERIYQAFKARLIEEAPAVIRILVDRPEIEVTVQRRVIEVDGDGLRGRIGRFLKEGFFDQPRTPSMLIAELAKRGFSTAPPNISRELGELTSMGFLTRDNKWYRVVSEMRVNLIEG